MKLQEVLNKLQTMNEQYIADRIWEDPSRLPDFMAEFAAYQAILISNYGDFMELYRQKVAKVLTEEQDEATLFNENVDKPSEKRSQTEVERRVNIRISNLKGMREKFEAKVDAGKLLVSTMQSKRRAMSDEASGNL